MSSHIDPQASSMEWTSRSKVSFFFSWHLAIQNAPLLSFHGINIRVGGEDRGLETKNQKNCVIPNFVSSFLKGQFLLENEPLGYFLLSTDTHKGPWPQWPQWPQPLIQMWVHKIGKMRLLEVVMLICILVGDCFEFRLGWISLDKNATIFDFWSHLNEENCWKRASNVIRKAVLGENPRRGKCTHAILSLICHTII